MLRVLANFEPGLRGSWAMVVGTLKTTIYLEDLVCCCLICDHMLVIVINEC